MSTFFPRFIPISANGDIITYERAYPAHAVEPLCGCLPIYKVAQGPQEMQRIKLLRLRDFFAIVQFTFASVAQVVLLKALCSCSSAG